MPADCWQPCNCLLGPACTPHALSQVLTPPHASRGHASLSQQTLLLHPQPIAQARLALARALADAAELRQALDTQQRVLDAQRRYILSLGDAGSDGGGGGGASSSGSAAAAGWGGRGQCGDSGAEGCSGAAVALTTAGPEPLESTGGDKQVRPCCQTPVCCCGYCESIPVKAAAPEAVAQRRARFGSCVPQVQKCSNPGNQP